jgi:hypothetical protein
VVNGGAMIVGGLFLAAFFVITGIRIVRKSRRNRTLGVLLLLLGSLAPSIRADMPRPKPSSTSLGTETIAGGLFLAAFAVCAGVLVVKRKRNCTLGLLFLLAGVGSRSYADIPPRPPTGTPVQMEISMDYDAAGGPILRVPRNAIRATQGDAIGSGPELVIGGIFLSAAMVLAGIWLARRRTLRIAPAAGMAALVMAVVAASFAAGALWAQERLRLSAGDLNGSVEVGQTRSGVVALQIVAGDKAQLLLPPPRRPRPRPPAR